MSAGFLIVEDEAPLARTLARQLERHRSVRIAHDLGAARAALGEQPHFTGILLDVILPDGSGLDLLEEIRRSDSLVPVVVLTGELDREFINRAQRLGAHYVCKPASTANIDRFAQQAMAQEPVADVEIAQRIDHLAQRIGLSKKERQVLALSVNGLSRRELASALGVAENTVKAQIRSLLKKSGARSLATLAQQVIRG